MHLSLSVSLKHACYATAYICRKRESSISNIVLLKVVLRTVLDAQHRDTPVSPIGSSRRIVRPLISQWTGPAGGGHTHHADHRPRCELGCRRSTKQQFNQSPWTPLEPFRSGLHAEDCSRRSVLDPGRSLGSSPPFF